MCGKGLGGGSLGKGELRGITTFSEYWSLCPLHCEDGEEGQPHCRHPPPLPRRKKRWLRPVRDSEALPLPHSGQHSCAPKFWRRAEAVPLVVSPYSRRKWWRQRRGGRTTSCSSCCHSLRNLPTGKNYDITELNSFHLSKEETIKQRTQLTAGAWPTSCHPSCVFTSSP